MTPEQKEKYDAALIKRGLLLPPKKPGPKVAENPFASVAHELFAAESGGKLRNRQAGCRLEEAGQEIDQKRNAQEEALSFESSVKSCSTLDFIDLLF